MTLIYEKMSLYHFVILRKEKWTLMKTKQLQQDILNQQKSIGFPKPNVATETGIRLTFYSRRVENATRFMIN